MTIHRKVTLVEMKQTDLATLRLWFEDRELSKRLGGMLPLEKYFDYVQSEPDYFAWMALEGANSVGAVFMQIEPGEPQGFVVLVKPELRSQGYGRSIIRQLMAQAQGIGEWKVGIEPDNIASRRCHEAAGFVPQSGVADNEGFMQYICVQR